MKTFIRIEDIKPRDHIMLKALAGLKTRAWVAKIGKSFKKDFLQSKICLKDSNSVETRGVYKEYILEYYTLYEISAPKSWRRTDRYFAWFDEHGEHRMSHSEVERWLKMD